MNATQVPARVIWSQTGDGHCEVFCHLVIMDAESSSGVVVRGDDRLSQAGGGPVSSAQVLEVVLVLRKIRTADGHGTSFFTLDCGDFIAAPVCHQTPERVRDNSYRISGKTARLTPIVYMKISNFRSFVQFSCL